MSTQADIGLLQRFCIIQFFKDITDVLLDEDINLNQEDGPQAPLVVAVQMCRL